MSTEKDLQDFYDETLAIYNSNENIAYPTICGNYIYNFWQDANHVRGIWRRSPLKSYTDGKPGWETLIDLDELSAKDDEKWVFKGASRLYPDYNRFLVGLSDGGADAVHAKEFGTY